MNFVQKIKTKNWSSLFDSKIENAFLYLLFSVAIHHLYHNVIPQSSLKAGNAISMDVVTNAAMQTNTEIKENWYVRVIISVVRIISKEYSAIIVY